MPPSLRAAYGAAGTIYKAGDIGAVSRLFLAMNFLMDRSAENWRKELSRLEAEVGGCDTSAPVIATGDLSGTFVWKCERGKIEGNLLLAPTYPQAIQALRLSAVKGP